MVYQDQKEIYINHLKELIVNILEIEEELFNLIKSKINIWAIIQKKKKKEVLNNLNKFKLFNKI